VQLDQHNQQANKHRIQSQHDSRTPQKINSRVTPKLGSYSERRSELKQAGGGHLAGVISCVCGLRWILLGGVVLDDGASSHTGVSHTGVEAALLGCLIDQRRNVS
jgi:hypothetical protein